MESDALAHECAIAFGNLRASLLASAHLLAERDPGGLPLARDLVEEHLARGQHMPAPLQMGAGGGVVVHELDALCTKAAALLKATRQRVLRDETFAFAARRLDADLCIARGVARAASTARSVLRHERDVCDERRDEARDEARDDGRKSDVPPDPARRTG